MKRYLPVLFVCACFLSSGAVMCADGSAECGGVMLYYSDAPAERYGIEIFRSSDSPHEIWSGFGGVIGFIGHEYDRHISGEIEIGIRASLPTSLSPFAGLGGTLGHSSIKENEDDSDHDWFASLNPEIGIHLWVTERFRLTALARYYITSHGRDEDFWAYGIGFGTR